MTLLSGHSPRRPHQKAGPLGPIWSDAIIKLQLSLDQQARAARFRLQGASLLALPEGALWIEEQAALVVSDLHLEKGSSYGRRGQFLPPYDTSATLNRLAALMGRLRPKMVVSLGDSFHDCGGPDRMDGADRRALMRLVDQTDFIWIEGNHDPAPPDALGGRRAAEIALSGLVFRHEPQGGAISEIAGHLHPCARVAGRGRVVRARCFATDGARLVMPAFGAYAGGLNVRDAAFDPVFPAGCLALMLGRDGVHPAPPHRLLADGLRA